jgi:hypothetical protein
MGDKQYDYENDSLSRIVRLETKMSLKFDELEKALVLAREMVNKDLDSYKGQLGHRLDGMNEFQRRMDKLEGTFVTKEILKHELSFLFIRISTMEKLFYIGIGVILALQLVFKYFIRG